MRNAANKIKRPAIDEGMGKEHKKPHEVSLLWLRFAAKSRSGHNHAFTRIYVTSGCVPSFRGWKLSAMQAKRQQSCCLYRLTPPQDEDVDT